MKAKNLSAIVLCAGYSSRMHAFKPLLPFTHGTVVDHVIQTLKETGINHIFVVLGHRAPEMEEHLAGKGVHRVFNTAPQLGMFHSIKLGVSAACGSDGFFVVPVDIPLIQPDTYRVLAHAFYEKKDHIFIPSYQGKRGHPPLLRSTCEEAISKAPLEGGLRQFYKTSGFQIREVPTNDPWVLVDMDTPEAYQKLKLQASIG